MVNKDNLKNLLSIAPVPTNLKPQFLALIDTANEDKLLEIESFCWEALFAEAELKKQKMESEYMLKVEKGEITYSVEEMNKFGEIVSNELKAKIDSTQTAGQLNDIREKLQAQTPNSN